MKRLLIFSAYYEPEVAASLYLSTNLYEDFARHGWHVDLFVPMPTRGVDEVTRHFYKKHKLEKKLNGNLTIHRISLMREGKGTLYRAIRYALMNLAFVWKSIFTKADAIFVQSTPPTQGAMAAIIKKMKKIPFVYNLQDIFPDSMVGMGMIVKESWIYKIGRIIEDFTYRNADKIIVISNDMRKNVIDKGLPAYKIKVISNWIDTQMVHPIEKMQNNLYEKFSLNRDDFHIIYAGNLGYAQNIEVIIKAAKKLESYKDIKIIIFGQGAQEDECKKLARLMKLSNLHFYPMQPYSNVSNVYSLADASIVSCKRGLGGSAMPSKTWSIMACGTAILASFDSGTDMQKMIQNNQVGLFADAEDENALADCVIKLYSNRDLAKQMGKNARKYVEENANRELNTTRYHEEIFELVC